MIFPTHKKLKKGASATAVADFCSTQSSKGKIVMQACSNVQFTNGLNYAGAFVQKDDGILQYLAIVGGEQVALKATGLTMGVRTFPQLAGCQSVVWAFDHNTNTLAVSGNNAVYTIFSGNPKKIADIQADSLAFCQSRLFALAGKRVYMSNPTETTFADDIWVDLPTECVALVNNGELYAVGDNIYKLQMDGEMTDIQIKKLCTSVGVVHPQTVCAYGNKILFVANGNIMALQNGNLKVIVQTDTTPTCATMHQGLYYLFGQTDGTHTATSHNPHSGKVVSVHQAKVNAVMSNGISLLTSDGENGFELTSTRQQCHWTSQPINFDDKLTTKHLHRLIVQTAADVDVHIVSNARRIYNLKGKDTPQSLLLVGYGKHITVELHSNGAMSVKQLSLTARTSEVSV